MKADDVILKAEQFAMNFIAKIGDKSEQPARKQTFFLDNQEELQKYMGAMQKICINYNEEENLTNEDMDLLNRANGVLSSFKEAISKYQSELLINNDITSNSSKNKKAKELNIPIVDEATFAKWVEEGEISNV